MSRAWVRAPFFCSAPLPNLMNLTSLSVQQMGAERDSSDDGAGIRDVGLHSLV